MYCLGLVTTRVEALPTSRSSIRPRIALLVELDREIGTSLAPFVDAPGSRLTVVGVGG